MEREEKGRKWQEINGKSRETERKGIDEKGREGKEDKGKGGEGKEMEWNGKN